MTPLRPDRPDPPNPVGSVARALYDIAQGFDSPVDTEFRLRRALRLLRPIVPYDRCALLEAPAAGPARFVLEPDAPEEREALSRMLMRILTVIADEAKQGADWRPPDVAQRALWASSSHLAVPLVGLDRVLGVLFVRQGWADAYTDDHLRLLSVVASQIAAYLTACRLREQEAQIVSEHEAARAAAEAESRAKDEFLTMLAHRLRDPLVPIRFAMLTIRGQAERDPVVQRARDVVERQVKHLARLLDELLDGSRLTRDKVDLRKESLTLQTIVTEALETTLGFIDAREHRMSVSLPEEPLWLEADPIRLTRVVANLVNNAAKYTPRGGEISVAGYREGGEVVLRVRDTGMGISPEMLPRVFDLFARADWPPARSEGGLGVGLTLARTWIELHGGSINAHSEGPGRGSEFVVRLPVGAPVERQGATVVQEPPAPVLPRHILVVEDNDDLREMLRWTLERDGHRVEVARDGLRGVELALATAPEVAFIDVGLPDIDGYEVGRRIRAALGSRILLVAWTVYDQEQDRRWSTEAGFDARLVKPVSYEDLTRLLGRVGRRDG